MSFCFKRITNNRIKYPIFSDVDIEAQFSINQSRADEITMREDYGSLPMNMHDDGFGEIGFDTPDLVQDGLNQSIEVSFINFMSMKINQLQ